MLIFEFMEYLQVCAPCRAVDTFRPSILLKCVGVAPFSRQNNPLDFLILEQDRNMLLPY